MFGRRLFSKLRFMLLPAIVAGCAIEAEDPLKLTTSNQSLLTKVLKKSPELDSYVYRPIYLIQNSHWVSWLMAFATAFHKEVYSFMKYKKAVYKLEDGGEVLIESSLHYAQGGKGASEIDLNDKPLVIIIPGLLSTVEDHYHHTFCAAAEKHGYDWLLINYRGIRHQMKTTQPFSQFDYDTFTEVIKDVVKQNNGKRQIYLLGTSLGGHMVSNILSGSEFDEKSQIAGAVLLHPALDIIYGSGNVRHSLRGLYDRVFGMSFRIFMHQSNSVDMLKKAYNENGLAEANKQSFEAFWDSKLSLFELQEKFLNPVIKIEDSTQACLGCLGIQKIQEVKNTPMMVIKAENDFLVGGAGVDEDLLLKNPNVILAKTQLGGHVGYFEKYWSFEQFQNEPIMSFFNAFRPN